MEEDSQHPGAVEDTPHLEMVEDTDHEQEDRFSLQKRSKNNHAHSIA